MAQRVLASEGRVKIRRFRRSDLKQRMLWPPYRDCFFRHLNYPLASFVERERWLLTRITNTGRMYFAVEDEFGSLIGEMSLREIDTTARASRLGIHLASNKVDLGYGTEALKALLDYYFNQMRYNVLFLDVASYNLRAIRLYEKLHFQHIRPFWRMEGRDIPVFEDQIYEWMRPLFRRKGPLLECQYLDMSLTRESYFEKKNNARSVADTDSSGKDDDAETIQFQKRR